MFRKSKRMDASLMVPGGGGVAKNLGVGPGRGVEGRG